MAVFSFIFVVFFFIFLNVTENKFKGKAKFSSCICSTTLLSPSPTQKVKAVKNKLIFFRRSLTESSCSFILSVICYFTISQFECCRCLCCCCCCFDISLHFVFFFGSAEVCFTSPILVCLPARTEDENTILNLFYYFVQLILKIVVENLLLLEIVALYVTQFRKKKTK